jgi:predicted dienelactone hydrolase
MTTTHSIKALCKAIFITTCAISTTALCAATNKPEQLYPPITHEVLPELAGKGTYRVGVRTLTVLNPAQFDPASQSNKDRSLTLEVWYPSAQTTNKALTSYTDVTRSGKQFTLYADAMRDVSINNKAQYPVVVLSHGYTGYRSIMYYLGEHLASHGYIVAAIDHTDSTNADVDFKNAPFSGFFSTLLNRSRDQQFVLDYFNEKNHFAREHVDTQHSGVIGYSMGGFGAVNTVGGCYAFNEKTSAMFTGLKDSKQLKHVQTLLNSCAGGQYQHVTVDPRIKAMVALAPWGGQHQLFDAQAMQNIKVPALYMAGSLDDISGYDGIKSLYQQTGSPAKYMLTYKNARHNIAPHPAPAIAQSSSELDLGHYYEPSWSVRTINEINKHFVLAMMDCHVKGVKARCAYLDLPESGDQRVVDGKPLPAWRGFDNRFSTGMSWQQSKSN